MQVNDIVYGAFGGHCGSYVLLNNTALVVGINVTSKEVVTILEVHSGPLIPQAQVQIAVNGSNLSDLYTGGLSLSTDGRHIFLVSSRDVRYSQGSGGDSIEQETFVRLTVTVKLQSY